MHHSDRSIIALSEHNGSLAVFQIRVNQYAEDGAALLTFLYDSNQSAGAVNIKPRLFWRSTPPRTTCAGHGTITACDAIDHTEYLRAVIKRLPLLHYARAIGPV